LDPDSEPEPELEPEREPDNVPRVGHDGAGLRDAARQDRRLAMAQFLWVCFGGAVGTGARYLLSGWMVKTLGAAFPYGTLAVNVIGSFLIAIVVYAASEGAAISPALRVVLATGVLGGFTTYSAFSLETVALAQHGAWSTVAFYVLATLLGCLLACQLGWSAARWLLA
jgi:CrcB protein